MPITPNMTLNLPSVSVTLGPEWATLLNAAFSLVDSHDHSEGKGVKVTQLGLNITDDLDINEQYLVDVGSMRLVSQGAVLATPQDIRSIYSVNGDLYYNNSSGTAIQITSGGSVTAASDGVARRFERSAVNSNTIIGASGTISYFDVDTSSGVTFTLPAANGVAAGRFYEFKDTTGSAGTNNIVINRAGSDTVDGATGVTIDQPFSAVRLISDGTSKWAVAPKSLLPTGSVIPYAGTTAPFGFLLCFGQAISRTTYAALYSIVGTTYGSGDGTTTFNIPDMRGRVAAGKDDMGGSAANRITSGGSGITGTSLGASGGSQTHTLSISEMPSHTHVQDAHDHTIQRGSAAQSGGPQICGATAVPTGNPLTSSVTATNQNTGGGGAHNNTQPTLMLNYIIRL